MHIKRRQLNRTPTSAEYSLEVNINGVIKFFRMFISNIHTEKSVSLQYKGAELLSGIYPNAETALEAVNQRITNFMQNGE